MGRSPMVERIERSDEVSDPGHKESPLGALPLEDFPLEIPRGVTVGRYVMLDKIGEGGMGVVYAAYDPELDRKLAVKLLRTAKGRRAESRRHRLIREAQAMARLNHRNVITVHDVGIVEEGAWRRELGPDATQPGPEASGRRGQTLVFVAMEFIDGGTLADWMAKSHHVSAVVRVFLAAGRGLAAAHEAGLVHRDFKPDNVMITLDGRAVVTDFGLARAAERLGSDPDEDEESGSLPRIGAKLSTTVTAAGAIMGTPAYMAPEQHEGRRVDARSDQFSFAVALYEAVYGERPFPGTDLASLAYNVGAGNLRAPPARTSTPSWLRSVLVRALSVDPEHRYDSMDALLDALDRERSSGASWWQILVGGAAVAGVGVYAGYVLDESDPPCPQAPERLEQALGPARLSAARSTFEGSGLSFAAEEWPAVELALTEYAQRWEQAYLDACEDTHVRGEQSETLLDLRMSCLTRRLEDADALIDLLTDPEGQAVANALEAAQSLPPPRACGDTDALLARVPPPKSAVLAGRVEDLRPQLARVAALERAGVFTVGLQAAQDLVVRTADLDYPPLQAEARFRLASLQRAAARFEEAEANYRRAFALAVVGRADELASESALGLVKLIGRDPSRAAEAESWASFADALLERTDAEPAERAELLVERARLLEARGKPREARGPLTAAVGMLEDAHGRDDARVADALASLGALLQRLEEYEDALPLLERALELTEYNMGLDHPRTADMLETIGAVRMGQGRYESARLGFSRALAIREAAPSDPRVLTRTLLQTGQAYLALGRGDAARQELQRAVELEAEDPELQAQLHLSLAEVALREGQAKAALKQAERARLAVAGRAEAAVLSARIDAVAVDAVRVVRSPQAAVARFEVALASAESSLARHPSALAPLLVAGAEAALAGPEPGEAVGWLERALPLTDATKPAAIPASSWTRVRARCRLSLAGALPPSSVRARELALQAQELLTSAAQVDPLRVEVDAWLAARVASAP